MPPPIWVVDTSAVVEIKSFVPRDRRDGVFDALSRMVGEGRLRFPIQVLHELKRDSEGHVPDRAYVWASGVQVTACASDASLAQVKAVLAIVPDVLDSEKESGTDEADPYILALA